jgi:acetyl esterase/lipase
VQNLVHEKYPPTFLFSMKYDPLVIPESNCLVAEKVLNEKSVPNEVRIYRGNVHGFGLAEGLEAGQWVNQSIEFFKKNNVL